MTFDKVKKLLAEQLNISVDKITENSKVIDDLGADSLDVVEMLMTLEDEFNVTVTDEAIDTVEATIAADPRDATADYQMFSLSGENFQGSMLLEKGENTVWLRMTDKAGNIGYESTVVYVDIDEPTLTVTEDTVLDYMPATGFDIKGTAIDATPSSGAVILTVKEEFKAKGNANYIETTDSTDSAKNTISVNALQHYRKEKGMEIEDSTLATQYSNYISNTLASLTQETNNTTK